MRITWCETSWGYVAIAFSDGGIAGLTWPRRSEGEAIAELAVRWPEAEIEEEPLAELKAKLARYFRGEEVAFDEPVDLRDATPFQKAVWEETRRIPWGQTSTYGEIAAALGKPGAARAVGRALAANPVPIIIPCHRVLRSDGSLGGFGGGVELKKRLLELEAVALPRNP